jgi:predicted RNA-binding Zn-ribbon protein involved in translation (DUF1610 family)
LKKNDFIKFINNRFNGKIQVIEFENFSKPIKLHCIKHGDFITGKSIKTSKWGCKQCYYDSLKKSQNDFIKEAKEKFPEYDFSNTIYINRRTSIKFICPKHGEQTIYPGNMLYKNEGCKECGNEHKKQLMLKDESEIIEKSKAIFNNKYYNYKFIYPENSRRRISMICKEHNYTFENTVANHIILKQGCKMCAIENQKKAITKSLEVYIEQCYNKFNTLYDFPNIENEYKNGESNISIKCNRCGNIFIRRAKAFLNQNSTCPDCNSSNGEIAVLGVLKKNKINYIHHYYFKDCVYKNKLEFDFYLLDYNIVIEYQGKQHYVDNGWKSGKEFKEQQIRDKIKREYCKNNGIKEIEIPYWDYDKIEQIILEQI